MAKSNNRMDNIITSALSEIELEAAQGMPEPEIAWADFEKRMKAKENTYKTGRKKHLARLALIASAALILILSMQNEQVTAFKNNVHQWIGKDADNTTVITEQENVEVENGTYPNLTFEEAQEMTIFQLVKPTFLPSGFEDDPEIEVTIHNNPLALVKITYTGIDNKFLLLTQENSAGDEKRNTFAPENTNLEEISLDHKNITLLNNNTSFSAKWAYNGVKYTVSANSIEREVLLKIIEDLK